MYKKEKNIQHLKRGKLWIICYTKYGLLDIFSLMSFCSCLEDSPALWKETEDSFSCYLLKGEYYRQYVCVQGKAVRTINKLSHLHSADNQTI